MSVWNRRILLVLALMCLLLTGCEKRAVPGENQREVTTWSMNAGRTGLVSETAIAQKQEIAEQVSAVASVLNSQTATQETQPLLPQGVTISETRIEGAQVVVGLSEAFYSQQPAVQALVRYGLTLSFTQFDEIVSIRLQVGGEDLKDSTGRNRAVTSRKSFVDAGVKEVNSYEKAVFVLYFADKDKKRLVRCEAETYYSTGLLKEEKVLELLVTGPSDISCTPVLPGDMNVLGVTRSGDTLYVNVDDAFAKGVEGLSSELIVQALVDSLLENSEANRVQLSVNGETNVTFQGIDLNRFFEKSAAAGS